MIERCPAPLDDFFDRPFFDTIRLVHHFLPGQPGQVQKNQPPPPAKALTRVRRGRCRLGPGWPGKTGCVQSLGAHRPRSRQMQLRWITIPFMSFILLNCSRFYRRRAVCQGGIVRLCAVVLESHRPGRVGAGLPSVPGHPAPSVHGGAGALSRCGAAVLPAASRGSADFHSGWTGTRVGLGAPWPARWLRQTVPQVVP